MPTPENTPLPVEDIEESRYLQLLARFAVNSPHPDDWLPSFDL